MKTAIVTGGSRGIGYGIAEELAAARFSGKTISELTNSNKCAMIKTLYYNNKTSIPQLSRILGLPRDIIAHALDY